MTERFEIVPLASIEPSPTNPRNRFDAEKLEELAESIREKGVVQPVVVRPHPAIPGTYELVCGERRYRGSKLAQAETIPAMVRELSDADVLEIQLLENNQREDVHPLEEADAIRRCLDAGVYGAPGTKAAVEALAAKLGKSARYVYDRLALCKLTEEARMELAEGNISAGHASLLVRLTPEGQRECITRLLYDWNWDGGRRVRAERKAECNVSVRDLANHIAMALMKDLAVAPFDVADAELVGRCGSCLTCEKRDGATETAVGKCLDASCFEEKVGAARTAKITQAIVANPKALPITTHFRSDLDPSVIRSSDYIEVAEGSEGAVPAVIVESYNDAQLGSVRWIRQTATPEQRQLEAEERAARDEIRKQKLKVELDFRKGLFDGVLSLRPETLPVELLRLAVNQIWNQSYGKPQEAVKKAMGLPAKSSYDEPRKRFEAAGEADLVHWLLLLLLTNERTSVNEYNVGDSAAVGMLLMAKAFGVDVDHIRREAEEKHAPRVTKGAEVVAGSAEKVAEDVLAILGRCRVEGNLVFLPEGQLERKLYERVDKALGLLGGKWDKRQKAHVFADDPEDALQSVINTGAIVDRKKALQFFPTPDGIVDRLCELAEIEDGHIILEPSAGDGAIVKGILDFRLSDPELIVAVEIDPKHGESLEELGVDVYEEDFLVTSPDYLDQPEGFDRIVMNPPFARQQDIDHVRHAYKMLKPGGVLVSVMSPSWRFRDNAKSADFRAFIERAGGETWELPEGTFKESGTSIRTVILRLRAAATSEEYHAVQTSAPEKHIEAVPKGKCTTFEIKWVDGRRYCDQKILKQIANANACSTVIDPKGIGTVSRMFCSCDRTGEVWACLGATWQGGFVKQVDMYLAVPRAAWPGDVRTGSSEQGYKGVLFKCGGAEFVLKGEWWDIDADSPAPQSEAVAP
ncbi:MAG: ParB/RepB/Spo0J family partition protein [Fimbriimonas sp.]